MKKSKSKHKKKKTKMACKCEIIIGLVGGIGTDWTTVINCLKANFSTTQFTTYDIKLTDAIKVSIINAAEYNRADKLIKKCNRLRLESKKDDAMAIIASSLIRKIRKKRNKSHLIYIIRQFKKPEEISTMRKIYGKNFILISVYQHRDQRIKNLNKSHKSHKAEINQQQIEADITNLILKDEKESNNKSGQNTRGTYVEADYFVDMKDIQFSMKRFTEILFGYPFNSPSIDEMNMSHAWNASLQ